MPSTQCFRHETATQFRGVILQFGWMHVSRRTLLAATAVAAAKGGGNAETFEPTKLKVIFTGGHPGDPECGCGGTIARYTALGHDAALLYLNRGQGYCNLEGDRNRCGEIRTAEAHRACEILKARPLFAGQYDGQSVVDNERYTGFGKLLDAENPDILFAQWPIDKHRDHRALSNLVLDAWLRSGKKAALFFYEVADDTMMFAPAQYVDISSVEGQRHAACYAHASQVPDKWYPKQVEITRFRGSVSGFGQAEAFVRHWESKPGFLP
jgi:LmbE family N-acetylglucosaminyl deacetylase